MATRFAGPQVRPPPRQPGTESPTIEERKEVEAAIDSRQTGEDLSAQYEDEVSEMYGRKADASREDAMRMEQHQRERDAEAERRSQLPGGTASQAATPVTGGSPSSSPPPFRETGGTPEATPKKQSITARLMGTIGASFPAQAITGIPKMIKAAVTGKFGSVEYIPDAEEKGAIPDAEEKAPTLMIEQSAIPSKTPPKPPTPRRDLPAGLPGLVDKYGRKVTGGAPQAPPTPARRPQDVAPQDSATKRLQDIHEKPIDLTQDEPPAQPTLLLTAPQPIGPAIPSRPQQPQKPRELLRRDKEYMKILREVGAAAERSVQVVPGKSDEERLALWRTQKKLYDKMKTTEQMLLQSMELGKNRNPEYVRMLTKRMLEVGVVETIRKIRQNVERLKQPLTKQKQLKFIDIVKQIRGVQGDEKDRYSELIQLAEEFMERSPENKREEYNLMLEDATSTKETFIEDRGVGTKVPTKAYRTQETFMENLGVGSPSRPRARSRLPKDTPIVGDVDAPPWQSGKPGPPAIVSMTRDPTRDPTAQDYSKEHPSNLASIPDAQGFTKINPLPAHQIIRHQQPFGPTGIQERIVPRDKGTPRTGRARDIRIQDEFRRQWEKEHPLPGAASRRSEAWLRTRIDDLMKGRFDLAYEGRRGDPDYNVAGLKNELRTMLAAKFAAHDAARQRGLGTGNIPDRGTGTGAPPPAEGGGEEPTDPQERGPADAEAWYNWYYGEGRRPGGGGGQDQRPGGEQGQGRGGRERERSRSRRATGVSDFSDILRKLDYNRLTVPQPSSTVVMGSGGVGRQPPQQPPIINIKQIVKQHVGDEHKRKSKAIKKSNKGALTKRRKVYNDLKKKTIAAINSGKNVHYKRENEKIKKFPAKQRKAARTKLRTELAARKKALVKQLPAAGRMKLADLERLINKVKQLKW